MSIKGLQRYFKILIFFTFCLIALGGAVRAMHAGLACPDWPLCFGKVIPDFQIQVYYEFIHRVLAGLVGIATLVLSVLIFKNNQISNSLKKTMAFALIVLVVQVIMGGLTVLKLLQAGIVTGHLAIGMLFLCVLLWGLFQLAPPKGFKKTPLAFNVGLWVVIIMVYVQIILGGIVSSNYAGLACHTFPLCEGQWFPTFSGILGIHITHRAWGYLTAIGISVVFFYILSQKNKPWVNKSYILLGAKLLCLICLQIALGAMNVIYQLPPVITVAHTAVAAIILGVMLRIFYLGITQKT